MIRCCNRPCNDHRIALLLLTTCLIAASTSSSPPNLNRSTNSSLSTFPSNSINETSLTVRLIYGPSPDDFNDLARSGTCNRLAYTLPPSRMDPTLWKETDNDVNGVGKDYFRCEFSFNKLEYLIERETPLQGDVKANAKWSCIIENDFVCNGKSQCATDECSCDKKAAATEDIKLHVFYRTDKSGCVAFANLCDGEQNCLDGSDESLCPEFVELTCPTSLGLEKDVFLPPQFYMKNKLFLDSLNCTAMIEQEMTSPDDPIAMCISMRNPEVNKHSGQIMSNKYSLSPAEQLVFISSLCKEVCKNKTDFTEENLEEFCDHVSLVSGEFLENVFYCTKKTGYGISVRLERVCDGTMDCKSGDDEIGCPGRFYCSANESIEWIKEEEVCDHTKDCSNGADECGTCNFGALSSHKFLINSTPILILAIVFGSSIVLLNIQEGQKCLKSEPSSKAGKIDRIFRLQIFFYDGLMGFYLICIVIADIVLRARGDYCLLDEKWRGSVFCSILGVIFTLSSHGSLFVVASVSVIRCLKCLRNDIEISLRGVVASSLIVAALNLVHSIVPLLPFAFVQDIFRTGIYLENIRQNPFLEKNPLNISRLNWVYEAIFSEEENVYTKLEHLKNITSNPGIFEWTEISYYGNTGLCVHNLFKKQQSYKLYKLLYIVVIVMLLSIVCLTYAMIVRKERKGKARLARGGNVGNVNADASASLTLKVMIMIGTQLIGWIPLVATTLHYQYFSYGQVPPMVFEVFALIVIPINSLLNPIFYSDIYKWSVQGITKAWNLLLTKAKVDRAPSQNIEVSLELQPSSSVMVPLESPPSIVAVANQEGVASNPLAQ